MITQCLHINVLLVLLSNVLFISVHIPSSTCVVCTVFSQGTDSRFVLSQLRSHW